MKFSDLDIVIDRNKVYTSYFAKASKIVPDRRLVSIALKTPDNWKGSYYRELNPSLALLYNYKSGNITEEQYKETYTLEVLDKLNPNEVYEGLKGKVLCCWEKSGEFCHRNLILEWLGKALGESCIGGEI